MKKAILKCYFCTGIIENREYMCEYDKKHDRNAIIKQYRRYVIKEYAGYIINKNLGAYKFGGKGCPVIIDLKTGMSIGNTQFKCWGEVCKTFKDIKGHDIEMLDKWLDENVRNIDFYKEQKLKFDKLVSGEIKEILERA